MIRICHYNIIFLIIFIFYKFFLFLKLILILLYLIYLIIKFYSKIINHTLNINLYNIIKSYLYELTMRN